ncbi:MAG: hypothetical protein V3U75_04095 [Methylococcaceae bacterium]
MADAKEELGEWFAEQIKQSIADMYKYFRAEGFKAVIAITLARISVQREVDQFIKSNFHSHIPGETK